MDQVRSRAPRGRKPQLTRFPAQALGPYSTLRPFRQPISQKSVSSLVASFKIATSSASRAGVGETVQVCPRLSRDLQIRRTGILGDPEAIRVRCGTRIRSRGEPRRDLRVADHAGGERHLER